jgi:DNA-binding response OmpR family regulator
MTEKKNALRAFAEKSYERDREKRLNQGRIDTLWLADRRLQIGPEAGRVVIDHIPKKMPTRAFEITSRLASTPDEMVTLGELMSDIYGWQTVTDAFIAGFSETFKARMIIVRRTLGEELGDPQSGAIRTVLSAEDRHRIGYIAVSEL